MSKNDVISCLFKFGCCTGLIAIYIVQNIAWKIIY